MTPKSYQKIMLIFNNYRETAIISSETSINHLTGDGHPDNPKE